MVRIWLAAVAIAGAAPALAVEPLVTGVAVYEVGLGPSKDGGVADVTGMMTAKIVRECETYITEAELAADIAGDEGVSLPLKVVSTHRETPTSLAFDITTSLSGREVDRAVGMATREGDTLTVALDAPSTRQFTIDGDALFPVEMLEAAIAAARAGDTFREFRTFDGTGKGEEVWTVSVLLGPAGEDQADEDDTLFAAGLGFEDLARWRMGLSYFPPGSGGEQTPAFSTSMVVYENGFAQAAVYDLGAFAMSLKLVEFSPVAPKPCP
jgi:hypothetical protein